MDNLIYALVTNETEIKEALEIRKQVFVVEQGISEDLEADGNDPQALHLVARDKRGIIGTTRIRFLADHQAKLERMAILKPFRGAGIGMGMVSFLTAELKKMHVERIVLHAQCSVVEFYRKCDFEEIGLPFLEAGIQHIKMEKKL